jgi:hypothetical protein
MNKDQYYCNFRYVIPPEHGKRLERLAEGSYKYSTIFIVKAQ